MPVLRPRPNPLRFVLAIAAALLAGDAAAATGEAPAGATLSLKAESGQAGGARLIVASPAQESVDNLPLATSADERLELLLGDGTSLSLWGDTALVVERFETADDGARLRLRLLRGTLRVVASGRAETTIVGPGGTATLAPGGAALIEVGGTAMRSVLLFGPALALDQAGASERIVRPGFAVDSSPQGIGGGPSAVDPAWLAGKLAALTFPRGTAFEVAEAEVVGVEPAAGGTGGTAGVFLASTGESGKAYDQNDIRQNSGAGQGAATGDAPGGGTANTGTSTTASTPTSPSILPPGTGDTTANTPTNTPSSPSNPAGPTTLSNPTNPVTPTAPTVVNVPTAPPAPELKLSFGQPLDDGSATTLPPVQYVSALNIAAGSNSGGYGFTRFSVPGHFSHAAPNMQDLVAPDAGPGPIVRDRDPRLAGASSFLFDESYLLTAGIGTATVVDVLALLPTPIGITVVNNEHSLLLGGGGSLRSGPHEFRLSLTGTGSPQVVPDMPDAFRLVDTTRNTFIAVGPASSDPVPSLYFVATTVDDVIRDVIPDPTDPTVVTLVRQLGPFRTLYFGGVRSPDAGSWFGGGFHVTRYTDFVSLPLNSTDINTSGFIPGSLRILAPALSADTQLLVAAKAAGAPAGAATVALRAALQFTGAGATQRSVIDVAVGDVVGSANDQTLAGTSVGSARTGGSQGSVAFRSGVETVPVAAADGPISMFGPTYATGGASHFVLSQGASDGTIAPLGAASGIFGLESVQKATAGDGAAVPDFGAASVGRASAASRTLEGYAGAIVERLSSAAPDGLQVYGLTAAQRGAATITVDAARNRVAGSFNLVGAPVGAAVGGADSAQFTFGGAGSAFITGSTFAALGDGATIGGNGAGATTAMVSGEPLRAALPNNTVLMEPNDYLQWGFWLADATTGAGSRDHVHLGTWVAGDPTPVSDLVKLAGQNVVGQYSGHAIGNVFDQASSALYTAVGQFDATVRFAQRRIDTTISNFDGRTLSGTINYPSATNRFQGSLAGAGVTGDMRGGFYGSQAQAMGGAFSLSNAAEAATVYRAEGTFAAKRNN